MTWRAQINDRGVITRYKDIDTGDVISAKEYERRQQMAHSSQFITPGMPQLTAAPQMVDGMYNSPGPYLSPSGAQPLVPPPPPTMAAPVAAPAAPIAAPAAPAVMPAAPAVPSMTAASAPAGNPLIQPGAQMLSAAPAPTAGQPPAAAAPPEGMSASSPAGKNLRMEGIPQHNNTQSYGYKAHGFLDATSIAILLPTLVLLALIIAAAHKKRLFPWQTIRTFSPPSGLMGPREYERSFLCPPNLRRHGRIGKRNPNATWTDHDGIVIPFGFLARTHLPVTIPLGRLPNKNMFLVAPSGSGKTTLMRAIMKAMLAKPCVIIALEAKANDPNLDEKKEGFKYTVLPEAQAAGFEALYFNPLDAESIHWNPLDLDPITFASSIVQDVNSLPPEEQHWAERDHGYITGLVTLLKWGAVQVVGEDENGIAAELQALPCNPRGLMRLVNNRRNIVESLRQAKNNPAVDAAELNELTQMLSSIIRTDSEWDKNIQGIRGRLRMFKNPNILRVTEKSNIDVRASMHKPSVLIFGAPASLGPDAESLAGCFVYQLQQALHTRYGTASVLPLFAFFDEYQTLNIDLAGRLSAIVRGANGGLAVILQNISQIAGKMSADPASGSELKTIFSNSSIRVCLHNADEATAKFFSDEIGKHAVIVPGISDHYDAKGFGIFPSTWNRIHSQQVVARVDTDSIKRMEKHHALVYLSPAGDSEFGETKPFMCDLRGIEEIARLHLLHNVTSRNNPPGLAAPVPGARPFSAAPGMPVAASSGGNGVAASARMCPHCSQVAGKGRFCIECGKPIPLAAENTGDVVDGGASEHAEEQPNAVEEVHGEIVAPAEMPAGVAASLATEAYPPVIAAPLPVAEPIQVPVAAAVPVMAQADAQPTGVAPSFAQPRGSINSILGNAASRRLPPAAPEAPAAPSRPAADYSQHIAAPAPEAARTHREAAAQRQPVTSLNVDASRLPVPQPQAPQRPQPPRGGVEF